MRAVWKTERSKAKARAIFSRGTSSGISAEYAGPSNACVTPMRKPTLTRCQSSSVLVCTFQPTKMASSAWIKITAIKIRRRSWRSAAFPAHGPKSGMTMSVAKLTSACSVEVVAWLSTTSCCACICIHAPTIETNSAIMNRTKTPVCGAADEGGGKVDTTNRTANREANREASAARNARRFAPSCHESRGALSSAA